MDSRGQLVPELEWLGMKKHSAMVVKEAVDKSKITFQASVNGQTISF